MLDARRRPMGRFFYCLLSIVLVWAVAHTPVLAGTAPVTTQVNDVVYRADGTPASGTILISWPAFTTSSGAPVAAGSKSVLLGTGGTLVVDLVPNGSANPAGTYYTVVFQLDDVVRTEYWVVGTTSPTTIGAVRTTPGSGTASQMVSRQYVDSAVAGKATDLSVVHLGGAETIAGTKLFSVSPTVPAPVASTDAVNKAYVDSAVASVGAGSFVSKNGDAMAGPLTLPGDPTSTNHASTKHYVDTALAVKASLVSGVVPSGQLGSGAADSDSCLKGNSAWGPCGTSSNATAIQNVTVDSSTPTDGQVITYDQTSGKYQPKTGVAPPSVTSIKYASVYNWQRSPSTPASLVGGANTITLAPCPNGLFINTNYYTPTQYVYIAGTGTAEAVAATRVSGYSGQSSCQISVTTTGAHAAGYTVGSASGGIKEASEAARSQIVSYNNWVWGGTIVIDQAGSPYKVYAPLHFEASWQTINNAGAQIQCYVTNDDCIVVGRRNAAYVNVHNITLNDLVVNAANGNTTNFAWDAVHVNAQSTTIHNVKVGYSAGSTPPGSFNSYVSVCDDESFTLDGMDVWNGYGLRSDRKGQAIYALAQGDTRDNHNCYAVGWLKHINGNLQCSGNVITWLSGNGLRVSDSVIQGFSQYGIRTGTPTGGYNGNTQIDNAYFESNCANPDYAAAGATSYASHAQAGVITQGGTVTAHGSTGLTGAMPSFNCSGSAGSTGFDYWAIANQTGAGQGNGASAPLYLGKTGNTCSGTVTGYFPAIMAAAGGSITYDILRTSGSGVNLVAPYAGGCAGGSLSACGSVVIGKTPGGGTIESFTDDAGSNANSYAVPAVAFVPYLGFWPGNLVLSAAGPSNRTQVPVASFVGEQNLGGGNGVGIVSVNGNYSPSTFSLGGTGGQSGLMGGAAAGLGSLDVHLGGYNTATLLMRGQQANVEAANLKGRLNFIGNNLGGFFSGSIITLVDSNPDKTAATANYRPTMDPADVWIGSDNASYTGRTSMPLAIGSPVSISHYINSLPDGSNWKERLTSTLKTFTVPVDAPGFKISGSYGTNGQCLKSTGSGSSWGSCGSGGGTTSPLTTKGDLWGFSTADARIAVGADGACLVADSTSALGVKWGSCSTGGVLDSAVVHNTGTETIGGDKTFSGNVTFAGSMLVSGPWQVESPSPTTAMTVGVGDSKIGFDTDGKLKVSENGGAVTEVAKVSQIPPAPAFQTNGVNNSSQGTLNLIPGTNVALTPGANGAVTVAASGIPNNASNPWLTTGHVSYSTVFSSSANKAAFFGVILPYTKATTQVTYLVHTPDGSATTYDIGIYSGTSGGTCTLMAHTGPIPGTTAMSGADTYHTVNWAGGAVTLNPGRYYLAITASATTGTAVLGGESAQLTFAGGGSPATVGNVGLTSGGTLDATRTCPTDLYNAAVVPAFAVN